ncbi:ThiF family adenylyltransferase [candidate division WOR-3 bacterium]|nr:ThiF family adenylyltransferase [candidate division WOR-3 bacterium]
MKIQKERFLKEFRSRTEIIYGEKNLEKLWNARVAVVGLGGVGSAAAEALCRLGVGNCLFIDKDELETSNLNRHLQSDTLNKGGGKAEESARRCKNINPYGDYTWFRQEINAGTLAVIEDYKPDYVVDAIDDIEAKIILAQNFSLSPAGFISSMGAGNKRDPSKIKISLLSETSVCPLARKMRKRTKDKMDFTVVYSTETGISGKIGSAFPVTASFGIYIACWIAEKAFAGGA